MVWKTSYFAEVKATLGAQYLASLENQHREETDFSEEDILAEYECESEQEEHDMKALKIEQNSNNNISVQERGEKMWGEERGKKQEGSQRGSGIKGEIEHFFTTNISTPRTSRVWADAKYSWA